MYRAYICCGPNCGPKGSGSLLDFLAEEVARLGLGEQVRVLPTGCQSHCDSGPTMVVYPGPVYYQEVDAERLRRIIEEHFVAGHPVKDYFWVGPRVRRSPGGVGTRRTLPIPPGPQPSIPTKSARDDAEKRKPRPKPDVDDFKW